MVNVLALRVFSSSSESDWDTITESSEDVQNKTTDDVNPHHASTTSTFSKKLIKSFVAVTKIKITGRSNSTRSEKLLTEMARGKLTRYSLKQLKSMSGNFSSILGFGGFASVYKGELSNGESVAIKLMKDTMSVEEQFMSEVRILGRTYHRNLVRLLGFCFEPKGKALVFEYLENGSLDRHLFSYNETINWEKLYHIAIETAKVISYLHEDCPETIVHYDINPANILVDSIFSPKIADFGLAEIFNRDNTHETSITVRGTHGYIAPELMMRSEATYRCDVYSFGMVLFEMVGRSRNFEGNHQIGSIMDSDWFPERVWEEFGKGNLQNLLTARGIEERHIERAKRMCMGALWCVQYIPENRPSMSSVVSILKGEIEVNNPPNPFVFFPTSSCSSMSTSNATEVVQGLGCPQSFSGSGLTFPS